MRSFLFLALVFSALPGSAFAEINFTNWCDTHECRTGNTIYDQGFQSEPWVPFESEDQLIWGADACLGYFMTRDTSSLNGGALVVGPEHHMYAVLDDMGARIHIFNYPFGPYGTF